MTAGLIVAAVAAAYLLIGALMLDDLRKPRRAHRRREAAQARKGRGF